MSSVPRTTHNPLTTPPQNQGGTKRKRSDDPASGLARISIPNLLNYETQPPPISDKSWRVLLPNGAIYEGQLHLGNPHGQGKRIWSDGSSYEGQWLNGVPHGKGKRIWSDGSSYEGNRDNGKLYGGIIITYPKKYEDLLRSIFPSK